jgi:hypothetical protein
MNPYHVAALSWDQWLGLGLMVFGIAGSVMSLVGWIFYKLLGVDKIQGRLEPLEK